jgi:hypothetical protein
MQGYALREMKINFHELPCGHELTALPSLWEYL